MISKKSFAVFLKRNLAFAKLAIVTNLEYRLNYFIDAIAQPVFTTGIEILLWIAVFKGANSDVIGGFTREYYLGYALWGAFFSRIATSWMYEARMIDEIGTGTINSIIVRPMGFYEYYLSQFLGYKFITTIISLTIPLIVSSLFDLPTILTRIPLALLLSLYFLILVHSISFLLSTLAFHFTKISSVTAVKNMVFWMLMGDFFPLDLLPHGYDKFFISLPFASGIFIPVGYITNRLDASYIFNGFISVSIALVIVNFLGWIMWKQGLKSYAGTGA